MLFDVGKYIVPKLLQPSINSPNAPPVEQAIPRPFKKGVDVYCPAEQGYRKLCCRPNGDVTPPNQYPFNKTSPPKNRLVRRKENSWPGGSPNRSPDPTEYHDYGWCIDRKIYLNPATFSNDISISTQASESKKNGLCRHH